MSTKKPRPRRRLFIVTSVSEWINDMSVYPTRYAAEEKAEWERSRFGATVTIREYALVPKRVARGVGR